MTCWKLSAVTGEREKPVQNLVITEGREACVTRSPQSPGGLEWTAVLLAARRLSALRPAQGFSCVRISPPLWSALCTFTYKLPALKLASCASVSFEPAGTAHSPSPFFSSVITGGPFLPAGAS